MFTPYVAPPYISHSPCPGLPFPCMDSGLAVEPCLVPQCMDSLPEASWDQWPWTEGLMAA